MLKFDVFIIGMRNILSLIQTRAKPFLGGGAGGSDDTALNV